MEKIKSEACTAAEIRKARWNLESSSGKDYKFVGYTDGYMYFRPLTHEEFEDFRDSASWCGHDPMK